MFQEIEQLVNTVSTHKALNNAFYNEWMANKLELSKLGIFVVNYLEFISRFPETLAMLIMTVEDPVARAEYTKTLYSEMGQGNPKGIHSILFESFCSDLSTHMGHPSFLDSENLQKTFSILQETKDLVCGEKELYSGLPAIATGAQLALEWQAYTMIRQLYEGARNYRYLWPNQDSFHESCEYFYVHIGSTEKAHKKEALTAAKKIIQNQQTFEQLEYGFKKHLDLIANFWEAIYTSMSKEKNYAQRHSEKNH